MAARPAIVETSRTCVTFDHPKTGAEQSARQQMISQGPHQSFADSVTLMRAFDINHGDLAVPWTAFVAGAAGEAKPDHVSSIGFPPPE